MPYNVMVDTSILEDCAASFTLKIGGSKVLPNADILPQHYMISQPWGSLLRDSIVIISKYNL
jgi:hypothetical protein